MKWLSAFRPVGRTISAAAWRRWYRLICRRAARPSPERVQEVADTWLQHVEQAAERWAEQEQAITVERWQELMTSRGPSRARGRRWRPSSHRRR